MVCILTICRKGLILIRNRKVKITGGCCLEYFLSLLEGIIAFISPCLLPMLPVYLSYFAGQENDSRKTLINAAGFVSGFTVLFTVFGALAGKIGGMLNSYQSMLNIVCGGIMIVFGLNFAGVIRIKFINNTISLNAGSRGGGFFASAVFGAAFSVSWTPCVGTFLGSALMLAAQSGSGYKGVFMLLCFSLGLGIPFMMCALLIDRLKGAFDFIKRHYRTINLVSGILLVILGVVVAAGLTGYLYAWI